MKRKGLGKGLGMGYKNLVPIDSHIHSLSAKGVKSRILEMKRKTDFKKSEGFNYEVKYIDGTTKYFKNKPSPKQEKNAVMVINLNAKKEETMECPYCGKEIYAGIDGAFTCGNCGHFRFPKGKKLKAKGKRQIKDRGEYYLVDDRYAIYKDDGTIYDMEKAEDIPSKIFDLREELAKKNKVNMLDSRLYAKNNMKLSEKEKKKLAYIYDKYLKEWVKIEEGKKPAKWYDPDDFEFLDAWDSKLFDENRIGTDEEYFVETYPNLKKFLKKIKVKK